MTAVETYSGLAQAAEIPRPIAARETAKADLPGGEAPSVAELLVLGMQRRGFACRVTVGGKTAGPAGAAEFGVMVKAGVAAEDVAEGLAALGRGATAAGIRERGSVGYRERLEINERQEVVAIRREFGGSGTGETATRRRGDRGGRCLGMVWRMTAVAEGAGAGTLTWRTLRRLMRGDLAWVQVGGERPEGAHGGAGARAQRGFYDAVKRVFDVAFAAAALLATLPICVVVAILIKLQDRGPVFFTHRREGLGGRRFGCLKFRTMTVDADARQKEFRAVNKVDGPQFKLDCDPRITRVGHFLRKTHIDELPQFVNVLKGEMSVVGPRPSPFSENQLCPGWREARLSVKPGITGLWQVSRSRERGATDFQEWIYFDTTYVEKRGFWLDLKIVLLTIKEMFGKSQ